jgi:hypothetical protein
MNAAVEFEVQIDGEQIKGWVAKDGSSYRAYGDFRGERIDVRSTTRPGAESRWRQAANHRANQ